jgi:short subunit dehydrogenase-like uncharacterized protein
VSIAVYGASGYTGKLVVAELARRAIDMVLVGRDVERLREVAARAGVLDATLRIAEVGDQNALVAAFRGTSAVISCAGPFARLGEPVVRAALAAGCHYLDTTGEERYMLRLFDMYGPAAERAGLTIIPAVTFEGVAGDLIAHLVGEQMSPIEELTIALDVVSGGASRGTLRTALEIMKDDALGYADGEWRPVPPTPRPPIVFFGGTEPRPVVTYGLPPVVTIPRHVRARRVEGAMGADVFARLAAITPELIENVPEGPPEDRRRAARWSIVADAVGPDGHAVRGEVTGPDMYGVTAVVAVESACRLAVEGARAGVLAPAEAFDPASFLDSLAPHGVRWSVEHRESTAATRRA